MQFKMNENFSREELENQIAELKNENKLLRLSKSFQPDAEIEEIEFLIAKQTAAESYVYMPTILNNMGDSVFVKDADSRLIFVNDAFCEMFHLPRTEIIGETLADNVSVDERESFLKIDKQVLLDGIENINEETLTVKEGQTVLISTRKSRFIDSNGKKFLVGVIRDVTKRKKAEQALIESESKFRELNATKDKLFSIIAHDLRGPFNNILSLAEMLITSVKVKEAEESEQYIGMIHTTAQNTLVLLDNLLNWAKSQTGQLEYKSDRMNVSAVVKEIITLLHSGAKAKNISLQQIEGDEIEIHTDEKMVKIILRNLISNAIKFTKPKGNIQVSVRSKDNHVEISVLDNGIGINKETCKKLFGISSTLSSPGTANEKGSGFGLVLCKEFVDKLKGDIWVESEEGKGSAFKFTLPFNVA
jgi:PAS domain S-box-containing protein